MESSGIKSLIAPIYSQKNIVNFLRNKPNIWIMFGQGSVEFILQLKWFLVAIHLRRSSMPYFPPSIPSFLPSLVYFNWPSSNYSLFLLHAVWRYLPSGAFSQTQGLMSKKLESSGTRPISYVLKTDDHRVLSNLIS